MHNPSDIDNTDYVLIISFYLVVQRLGCMTFTYEIRVRFPAGVHDLIACSYFSFTSRAIVETDNTHEIGSLRSALR